VALCFIGGFAVVRSIDSREASGRLQDYLAGEVQPYTSAEGRFRADFPGPPAQESSTETVGAETLDMTTYLSKIQRAAFGVSFFDLRPDLDGAFDLELGVNGSAVAIGGAVEEMEPLTFLGHPAMRYRISTPKQAFILGVLVHAPGRVYQVITVGQHLDDDARDAHERFVASVEILPS
jgi:hypothetical protein